MEVLSIEELHQKIINHELDLENYYQELFEEVEIQQKRLNAFVTITKDKAYDNIKDLQVGKKDYLKGIPGVLKDNYSTQGIKTTAGSKMLEDYIPVYDATVTKKLYEAGMSLIGKSSLDELAMGGTNKTALTGPVMNPWDHRRIAGGSSGGSAALVGSGVVPFALGSDTGDSIRRPAGFCGVVGFKPTWGRISRYGVIPYASSLDHMGALTRNVRDMAIVIEAISGRDDHDMTSSYLDVPCYLDYLTKDIKGIKIAVLKTVVQELRHPQIKKNFYHVVETLKQLGAIVEEVEIPLHLAKAILPTYKIIANSEATSNHACLDGIKYGYRQAGKSIDEMVILSRSQGFGAQVKRRFILGNLALASNNQDRMLRKAQKVRRLLVNQLNKIYETYDMILTPNGRGIAPFLDEAQEDFLSDEYVILENHMALANFAGVPALSLPSGFVDGMPIAVHLMGKLFDEQTILNVSYALEEALGYKNQYSREG